MGKEANSKSSESRSSKSHRPAWWRFVRYSLVIALAGLVALAWISVLSHSSTDPPGTHVYPPLPVRNWAGVVGAYLSFLLFLVFGDGTYMLLLFGTVVAAVTLLGGRIGDLYWRLGGLALMVMATASASHVIQSGHEKVGLESNGGIIGRGLGELLLVNLNPAGTWIILLSTFAISVMLTADRLVLQLPGIGRRLWQRHGKTVIRNGQLALAGGKAALDTLAGGGAKVATAVSGAGGGRATAAPTAEPGKPSRKDVAPIAAVTPAPAPPRVVLTPRPGLPRLSEPAPAPPPRAEKPPKADKPKPGEYQLPGTELLSEPSSGYLESQEVAVEEKRAVLQQTLDDFGVEARVIGHQTGPVISLFELSLAPGVKVSQIQTLAPDIARALAVPGVRVVSPLAGRDTVGVEVPNLDKEIVRLKELMGLAAQAPEKMQLPLYLGKDASGEPIVADLAGMPHLLLAGTTGSGKSVCINAVIASLLLTRSPRDVRLILIDPKMVEMAAFEKIPHLLCPIVNDMRRAESILEWAAVKMDERYEVLKEAGVRNIVGFNALPPEEIHQRFGAETDEEKAQVVTHMTYIVIIIDELADLIMTSSKEVEGYIIRIAQKARAVGIHLIVATQRPSVNVVTGLIKSNMPCRVSFRVASRQESRIVLDQNGAEVLLGRGDMLFLQPGTSQLIRAQGTYVDEREVRALVDHVKSAGEAEYCEELVRLQSADGSDEDGGSGERDGLFHEAVEIVLASQRGSVSLLQRRLQIGYSRASRIVDQMAEAGILGDYKGSQARECLMTLEEWQTLKQQIQDDQSGESAANGEPTSS